MRGPVGKREAGVYVVVSPIDGLAHLEMRTWYATRCRVVAPNDIDTTLYWREGEMPTCLACLAIEEDDFDGDSNRWTNRVR